MKLNLANLKNDILGQFKNIIKKTVIHLMIPIIILIFIILIISSAIIAIIASIFSVEVGANNNSGGIESVDYSNVVTTTADGRISYARLNISDEDKQNLYNITSAERGDGTQVQQEYVTSVILNRVLSSHYPNTIMEVISAPSQFSPYSDGSFYTQTISQTTKDAVENVLANGDTTGGCTYFMTPGAMQNQSWALEGLANGTLEMFLNDAGEDVYGNSQRSHNIFRKVEYAVELRSYATATNNQGNVTSSDPDFYPSYANNISSSTILSIVNTALAQEGKNLNTLKSENSDIWTYPNDNWCADFVSFCFARNGQIGSGKAIERWQRAAHNGFKIWADNEYGSRCYSENYTPKAGDVIIFSWSHVGLVYGCDGNYVYCVEGKSTTNDYNTSKVSLSKYSLSSGNIYGYYPTSEKIN